MGYLLSKDPYCCAQLH